MCRFFYRSMHGYILSIFLYNQDNCHGNLAMSCLPTEKDLSMTYPPRYFQFCQIDQEWIGDNVTNMSLDQSYRFFSLK